MASVKIKGLNKLQISVRKKLIKIQSDNKMLKEIATFSVDRIKAFARKGRPLRSLKFGKPGRFPSLAPATAKMRRELAKNNTTHATYGKSGNKRNLTITGQLIEATKSTIKRNLIFIFISGRRSRYKDAKGKSIDGPRTNEKLFKELKDRNKRYNFLGMDKLGAKRIRTIIKQNLRRLLK